MTNVRWAWMLLLAGIVVFIGLSLVLLEGPGSMWLGTLGKLW